MKTINRMNRIALAALLAAAAGLQGCMPSTSADVYTAQQAQGSKACVWEQLSQYARSRFRQMAENPAESARSAAPWQAALRAARLAAEGDPLWPRLEAHLRARHWALWPKASLESVMASRLRCGWTTGRCARSRRK